MEPLLETIELDVEESNELLFKVKVEGVEQAPAKVRLVCEVGDVAYMFHGHSTSEEGVVQFMLPVMKDKLKEGTYLSRVEVLIENRYFAPVQFNTHFKKTVTVVAESMVPTARRPVPQVSVSASAPVVVKKPQSVPPPPPVARSIVVEQPVAKPVVPPVKPVHRPAARPQTLAERRAAREQVIDQVDETNENLIKELAQTFVRGKRK